MLLTGLAGLLSGALSMGAGEYISVRSQRELLAAVDARPCVAPGRPRPRHRGQRAGAGLPGPRDERRGRAAPGRGRAPRRRCTTRPRPGHPARGRRHRGRRRRVQLRLLRLRRGDPRPAVPRRPRGRTGAGRRDGPRRPRSPPHRRDGRGALRRTAAPPAGCASSRSVPARPPSPTSSASSWAEPSADASDLSPATSFDEVTSANERPPRPRTVSRVAHPPSWTRRPALLVHPAAVGRRVVVTADLEQVVATLDGTRVAAHARCWARHQSITDPAHAKAAARLRQAYREPAEPVMPMRSPTATSPTTTASSASPSRPRTGPMASSRRPADGSQELWQPTVGTTSRFGAGLSDPGAQGSVAGSRRRAARRTRPD